MNDISQASVSPDPELTARRDAYNVELRRRLVGLLREGRTEMAPGGVRFEEPGVYTDPVRFEEEHRALFLEYPTVAAFSTQMPNPGDVVVFDALGPSIVLTRNKQGRVNAFLNMCTHRAARVVDECGHRNRLNCRFHGWSFDLDGKLAGFPGADGFPGVDRAQLGLIRVPVGEKYGLIFVKGIAGDEEIDVDAHLGDFAPMIAQLEIDKARPIKQSVIDADANWKYVYDTYYEGYHFASLHARTIGALAVSNVMSVRTFGPHIHMGMPRKEFTELVDKPESEWPVSEYGGLYLLFPNISLNIYGMPDGGQFVSMSRVYPGKTVGTSRTLQISARAAHSNPDLPDSRWEELHDFIEHVVKTEDYSVSETGQNNLKYAPPGFRPVIGANELAIQQMHSEIERILADYRRRNAR